MLVDIFCFCYFSFIDPPAIPEMDVVFALSANALKDQENFRQMKDIIKTMIDRYGTSRIQYAVITFGNIPTTRISFNDVASLDDKALKALIDSVQKSSGALLEKALEQAKLLFETQGRPDAKRILVVITDKKSSSSLNDFERQAKSLEDGDIKVIPIALGKESDVPELAKTTPNKENLIDVDEGDDPEITCEVILRKALKGNPCYMLTFLEDVFPKMTG